MTQIPNRLIKEKSPYLQQHAYNPVEWYPWHQDAFEKARVEDKLVLLSIGYSTCHWCHVMAHESFENEEIAKIMNENFVCIKVDREERPDIDQIYMSAVTAMSGQGGWPLTVFLTSDQKPFFGGTYFPPYARWGSPGFVDVLNSVNHSWKNQREQILQSSHNLTTYLQENILVKSNSRESLTKDTLDRAFYQLSAAFDSQNGGFGQSPKFPMGHNLSFLLRYWKRSGDKKALEIVEKTLKAMARGGMYDQIGGGFHRYSTDEYWHVPHFEKMLYDQALLARAYLEAYQITNDEFYARISKEIFDYVLRDMHDQEGGFFSAEDADSEEFGQGAHEKKEGAFYVWSQKEWEELLGKDAEILSFYFGVEKSGNARQDPHGEFVGKNILFVAHTIEETANHFHLPPDQIQNIIHEAQQKLFNDRLKKPRPHLDDKILVDWNGLMISVLAYGSSLINNLQYQKAAQKAADFIIEKLIDSKGRLLHRYREGEAGILGGLEDYAFFIQGLLDLYEATFKVKYLSFALKLSEEMVRLFEDNNEGGFFLTGLDAQALIVRPKEIYDGAIPSGNSVAAVNLLRLSHITGNYYWQEKADKILKNFSGVLSERPSGFCYAMIALDFVIGPSREIVIASVDQDEKFQSFVHVLQKHFIPRKVLLLRLEQDVQDLIKIAPYVSEQHPIKNEVTVYVCENHVCKLPLTNLQEFKESLNF